MRKLLVVAVTIPVLAACSPAAEGSRPSGAPAEPACAATWVVGKILPKDYSVCENGETIEAGISYCDDVFVRDGMAARRGEPIVAKTFDEVLEECS